MNTTSLLPTSLVGSYAQPDWLINREMLGKQMPPRVRALELWRVAPEWLEQAQDDATLLAIRDQERAGLDILTDGEMRRESYSNRFATALEGLDLDKPGTILSRSGRSVSVPRIVGKIRRKHPVQVRDMEFLRANTSRQTKITVPGPFTMTQQAVNEYYKDEESAALDYAAAVNEEIKDLFSAGADVVQIDEPYMQAAPEKPGDTPLPRLNELCKACEARRRCIRALATGLWWMAAPLDILSSTNWRTVASIKSRLRRRNARLIARRCKVYPGKKSSWACWTFRLTRSKRPRLSRHGYGARCRS